MRSNSKNRSLRSSSKLVEPEWRKTHNFNGRSCAYVTDHNQNDGYLTLALEKPAYMDVLATDESNEHYDLRIVGEGGYFILAHKLILCHSSPNFITALFDDQMPGDITSLYLPDVPIEFIQRMLEIAYNGTTKIDPKKLPEFKVLLKEMGMIRLRHLLPMGVSSAVDEDYDTTSETEKTENQRERQVPQVKPQEKQSQKETTEAISKPMDEEPRLPCSSQSITNLKRSSGASASNISSLSTASNSQGSTITKGSSNAKARHFATKVNKQPEEFIIISSDSEGSDTEKTQPPTAVIKKSCANIAHVAKPVEIVQRKINVANLNTDSDSMNAMDRERFPDPPERISLSSQEEDTPTEVEKLNDSDDIIEIFPDPKETPNTANDNEIQMDVSFENKGLCSSSPKSEIKNPLDKQTGNGRKLKKNEVNELNKEANDSIVLTGTNPNIVMEHERKQNEGNTKNGNCNTETLNTSSVNVQGPSQNPTTPEGESEPNTPSWRSCLRSSGKSAESPSQLQTSSGNEQASSNSTGSGTVHGLRSRKRKASSVGVVSIGQVAEVADEGKREKRPPKKFSDYISFPTFKKNMNELPHPADTAEPLQSSSSGGVNGCVNSLIARAKRICAPPKKLTDTAFIWPPMQKITKKPVAVDSNENLPTSHTCNTKKLNSGNPGSVVNNNNVASTGMPSIPLNMFQVVDLGRARKKLPALPSKRLARSEAILEV